METKLKDYYVLTGNIGSGKSTVGHYIREAGFPVVEIDQLTKDILRSRPEVRSSICALFGYDAVDFTGSLSDAVRRAVLDTPDMYDFLMARTAAAIGSSLKSIHADLGRYTPIFIESAYLDFMDFDGFIQQAPKEIFQIDVPNRDERIQRVVERYQKRNNIETERTGFYVLAPEVYEANRNRLKDFRQMAYRTDDMQTERRNSWYGMTKGEMYRVSPSVSLNDSETAPEVIARGIVEKVATRPALW